MKRKISWILFTLIGVLIYSQTSFGAFPSMVSPGDTLTSADWNALVGTATSTNPYPVSFTGHLTLNSASSTNQTITNLWLNATSTMNGYSLCTSGNGACADVGVSSLTGTAGQIAVDTPTGVVTLSIPNPTTLTNLTVTTATTTNSLFIPLGTMTLTANGQIKIDSSDLNFQYRAGGLTQVLSPTSTRSFTVASTSLIHGTPIRLRRAQSAETLKEVWCTQTAGALDSTTNFNLYYGSNVAQAGTQVWNAQTVETSTSTGTFYYAFDNTAISAGDMVWAKVATSTGATGTFSCDLYTKLNE